MFPPVWYKMGPKKNAKKPKDKDKVEGKEEKESGNMVRTSKRLANKGNKVDKEEKEEKEEQAKAGNRKRKADKEEAKTETETETETRTKANARKRGQAKAKDVQEEEEPVVLSPPRKMTRTRVKARTKAEQMELDEEENINKSNNMTKNKKEGNKKKTRAKEPEAVDNDKDKKASASANVQEEEENKRGKTKKGKTKTKAKVESSKKAAREPEVAREKTPPPAPAPPNAARVMKCLSKPSPFKRPPECADVYDMATYGEEEFGPEPEVKKKRRKRANKKMTAGDIILAFGSETKERAWTKLKEIKNIKTPPPVANNKVPNPIRQKPVPALLPADPIPTTSYVPPPDSPAGFSRDCDDYLPSFDHHHHGTAASVSQVSEAGGVFAAPVQPSPRIYASPSRPRQPSPSPTSTSNTLHPRYKTPAVPKHVRKVEGKVSTPRLATGDSADKAPELKLSTKELVKTCFGFDDSSEIDSEGESLLGGISPVKGLSILGGSGSNNLTERSSFQSFSTSSRLSSFSSSSIKRFSNANRKGSGPYRFEVALVPRQKKSEALVKASIIQKQRKAAAAKREAARLLKEAKPAARTSPRKVVKEDKVVNEEKEDASSLYEEDKENKEMEKRDHVETAPEQPRLDQDDEEDEGEGEVKNAFTVMKERNLDRSVYSNRRKSMEAVKEPKVVKARGAKKKRQALITEVMVKRGKKQNNKAEEEESELEEEDER